MTQQDEPQMSHHFKCPHCAHNCDENDCTILLESELSEYGNDVILCNCTKWWLLKQEVAKHD